MHGQGKKITDIYTYEDVMKSGKLKWQSTYNYARKYGRYDICLFIADKVRKGEPYDTTQIKLFRKWIIDYEVWHDKHAKDLITGKFYHHIMWDKVAELLKEVIYIPNIMWLKKFAIEQLYLPEPYKNLCYACCRMCKDCAIIKRAGVCNDNTSAISMLVHAIKNNDRQEAIKQAERVRDAWTR